ncbi:MAG: ion transporter [Euryarchaeota archaeon]|nr:ion transporter [Euryarchaeota archaeon]
MHLQNGTIKENVAFYLHDTTTFTGRFIDLFIICLNLFTVLVFIIESYFHDTNPGLFWTVEVATVSIFILEYVSRFWVAEKKIKHVLGVYSIIDLVAIIPTFITFLDLRFVRIFRVFRIFRFMRFVDTGAFISEDMKLHEIRIMKIIFTIVSIIFVFSSFIYEAERIENPDINDLGSAMYFSIVTLTTVGFGDIVPVTPLGRFATVLMILVSIALIPWQLGLLIKEFMLSTSKKRIITCEKCGLRQHDIDATHCKHCGSIIYHETDGELRRE